MMRKRKVSYVAQDPYLYSDTLIGNVFLGYDYDEEEKNKAYELLTLFGLSYLADDRDSLFAMEIGEKGNRLSGGQAKRLALVRS
jgi:ATP-binding cassette subfamily B protein